VNRALRQDGAGVRKSGNARRVFGHPTQGMTGQGENVADVGPNQPTFG